MQANHCLDVDFLSFPVRLKREHTQPEAPAKVKEEKKADTEADVPVPEVMKGAKPGTLIDGKRVRFYFAF